MKKVFKQILTVAMVAVFLFLTGCYQQAHKIRVITDEWFNSMYDVGGSYNEYLEKVIPSLDKIGMYKKATLYEIKFDEDYREEFDPDIAFCLDVKYTTENYESGKQKVLQDYEFQSEIIEDCSGGYILPWVEKRKDFYTFKVVKDLMSTSSNNVSSAFPHVIGVVAYNDREMKIRFCLLCSSRLESFDSESIMTGYIVGNILLGW